MADFTTCSFSLPIKITTATTIKLTLADSAVGFQELTAIATAGTYYNDLSDTISAASTSVLGMLLHRLTQKETSNGTLGTYSIVETTGSPTYRGRMSFHRAQGDASDDVTQIEVLGGEVTLAELGSTADPLTPVAPGTSIPAVFTLARRGAGHWVLPDESLLAASEERQRTIQTSTTSPDGTTIRDVYGSVTRKRLDLLTLPGASVFLQYASDADFAAVIGCDTGDAAATFDELRRRWCLIDDDVHCRFWPDVSDLTTYVDLRPGSGDEWMSSLDEAVEMVSSGPLYFDATIAAFKV